ncbi:hypothetical protein E2542_SST26657 [Spatholobus suberectus]|nr:hypothetical protein E2542_SST26657 [Spatholobus suberectus]
MSGGRMREAEAGKKKTIEQRQRKKKEKRKSRGKEMQEGWQLHHFRWSKISPAVVHDSFFWWFFVFWVVWKRGR